jgi:phosphoribosyl-ATP pyrophosphohydrolase
MSSTLYNISNEYKAIMAAIEANEGEITDEVAPMLEIVEANLQEKAVNYAFMIKHYEDRGSLIAAEIKRLQGLKAKADKTAEKLSDRIASAMQEFGITKVEGETITLSFRKSTAIEIEAEEQLNVEFMKFSKPVPDKTAIKKAIEEGREVIGARLVTNQNLQIK